MLHNAAEDLGKRFGIQQRPLGFIVSSECHALAK